MSNHEFENYLKLVGKLLQLTRDQQTSISVELRDHLESRVAELVDDGVSHQEAVGRAIEEFGDAAVMAKNFQFVSQLKRRRWMMRFATLSMAGLFMVAVLAMAMWPSKARFGTPDSVVAQVVGSSSDGPQQIGDGPSAASQLDAQLEQKLKQRVTLVYDETPWSEIEDELEAKFGINIVLDQSAIDNSLSEDEPISIDLKNVQFEHGLSILLKIKNATFIVDHGVMVVISNDDAANPEFLQMKMYDCRELLAKLNLNQSSKKQQGISSAPVVGGGMFNVQGLGFGNLGGSESKDNGQGGSADGGGGMGGLMGGGLGGGMGGEEVIETSDALLLDVLKSIVHTDSWQENGGSADARIVNGILIVKQTRAGISATDRFLQDLNFFVKSQPGMAKFPEGVEVPAKEPTRGEASNGNNANQDPFSDEPDAGSPTGGSAKGRSATGGGSATGG